eukprot:664271-Pleurochrysis_carterae.AAC.3
MFRSPRVRRRRPSPGTAAPIWRTSPSAAQWAVRDATPADAAPTTRGGARTRERAHERQGSHLSQHARL